jgi:hypothetical protein
VENGDGTFMNKAGNGSTSENWDGVQVEIKHYTWDHRLRKHVPKGEAPLSAEQKKFKLEFYQFPKAVIDQIVRTTHNAELAVLARLYELWFLNFQRNPVALSSVGVRAMGISRFSQMRALKSLEESKQISIERRKNKSPLVTIHWKGIQD